MLNINMLLSIAQKGISFILVFGLLVFVHELGHFLMARFNGVHVYEFAIGMGKKVFSYQGKETVYSLRLFPIGGFVNMMGEDEESDDPGSFSSKKPIQRFSVLFAGPFMNFLLALLIFIIFFSVVGVPVNTVGNVLEDYPAAQAGLQAGDEIIQIESAEITSWNEVTQNIALHKDNSFSLIFIREGQEMTVEVTTLMSNEGRQIIGIEPMIVRKPGVVVTQSFDTLNFMLKSIFGAFGNLVKGKSSGDEFVGPVGIINIVGETSEYGIIPLLHLTAILSINLGFINLLPFPALDGGRLVFVLYEMIFRKPFNQEKEQSLHYIGFIMLLVLMVFLVTRDIINFR